MRGPRTLNLLVAAAGLVFLTGCATETLTDSAFWSYLPFTSAKKGGGGNGGGGAGADKNPGGLADTTGTKPKPTPTGTKPAHGPAGGDEGWNEAPPKTPVAQPEAQPDAQKNTTRPDAPQPSVPLPDANGKPVTPNNGHSPSLPQPALAGTTSRDGRPIGLTEPGAGPRATGTPRAPTIGEPNAAPATIRDDRTAVGLPDLGTPPAKGARSSFKIPELVIDGIAPTTVGRPTVVDLPKRTAPVKPDEALTLPTVVTGPNATATQPSPNRLPKALTDSRAAGAPSRATLPLPDVLQATPGKLGGASTPDLPAPGNPTGSQSNVTSHTIAPPGAPETKAAANGTLSGGVDLGPLGAKPNPTTTSLPPVGTVAPLPPKPIPTPFRLSEWISNDALHQEWRRQQLLRTQQAPEERGSDQQRLRLVLDQFLLREKPSKETDGK